MISKNPLTRYRPYLGLLLVAALAASCNGRHDRKKLPDLNGDAISWEGTITTGDRIPERIPGLPPFFASDTTVRIGGRSTDLLAVSLPDPGYDSLAQRLVAAYTPFAAPLRNQLLAQGRKGLLIDLRTNAGTDGLGQQSETYLLEIQQPEAAPLSLPVVFCWDPASAGRATAFINALRAMPGFSYTRIDDNHTGRVAKGDCFSAELPTNFDQQ